MTCVRFRGLALVAPGEPQRVEASGKALCVARCDDGRIYAVSDACTHEPDASLSDGWLSGTEIECARHNSIFDMRTGAVLALPACEPLQTYPVTVEGDDVLIEVDDREIHET